MIAKKYCVAILLSSLLHSALAIYSGKPASQQTNAYHVAIVAEYSNKQSLLCSGAIINELWVLTAAHCSRVVQDYSKDKVKVVRVSVVAGENVLSRKSDYSRGAEISSNNPVLNPIIPSTTRNVQKRSAVKFIVPKGYRKGCKGFDVGVILLNEKLVLNEFVKTLQPADPRFHTIEEKSKCTISGWGETENAQPSIKLTEGHIDVVEPKACSTHLGFNITSNRICAGSLQRRSVQGCRGDSGSPLVCEADSEKLLFGIQSFVAKECGDGPAVYANVASYQPWVGCVTRNEIRDLTSDQAADYCDGFLPGNERVIKSECSKGGNAGTAMYVLLGLALTLFFVAGVVLYTKRVRKEKHNGTDNDARGQYIRRNDKKKDSFYDYDENMADHQPEIKTHVEGQVQPGGLPIPAEGSEQNVYLVL